MKARTMEIADTSLNIFHCTNYLIEIRSCDEINRLKLLLQKNLSIAELMDWEHFPCPSVPASDFEVNTVTLKHHLYYQASMLSFKCLKSRGPKYIADFFNLREVYFKPRGKESNLVQPYFNTKWMHKSFSVIASKLWNKLPLNIRNSNNLKKIKKALQKLNLESLNQL